MIDDDILTAQSEQATRVHEVIKASRMHELGLSTPDVLSELYHFSGQQKQQAMHDPFSLIMGEQSAVNYIKQHLSLVFPSQEQLEVLAFIDEEWHDALV